MEPNSHHLSSESFSYSLRLSFDAESFIEFDLKLMSMRWNTTPTTTLIKSQDGDEEEEPTKLDSFPLKSLSLDSKRSLLFHSNRHQSRYFYTVPCMPISSLGDLGSTQMIQSGAIGKQNRIGLSFRRFLWFVLMKLCRRMKTRRSAKGGSLESSGGRGRKVFDEKTCESNSIQDAVLYCKNSNLSSLMEDECKGD